jgi:hypothetical protein
VLDPFSVQTTTCGTSQNKPSFDQKLAFICKMEGQVNKLTYILYGLLVVSVILLVISASWLVHTNKNHEVENVAIRMLLSNRNRNDPEARARYIAQQRQTRIDKIQNICKKIKYGNSQYKKQ